MALFSLDNVTFHINERAPLSFPTYDIVETEHLLLSGLSGSGKTTLLHIIAGLLRPTAGDVVFDGRRYHGLSNRALDALRAENFGFVFQKLHLISHLTVAQNIALPLTHRDPDRVQGLIEELGLDGKAHHYARDLSIGEAQRVAIARAVAHKPRVIFADEPTSALDDVNTEKVMTLLLDQAQKTGATLIAATHDARIKPHFHSVLEIAA